MSYAQLGKGRVRLNTALIRRWSTFRRPLIFFYASTGQRLKWAGPQVQIQRRVEEQVVPFPLVLKTWGRHPLRPFCLH